MPPESLAALVARTKRAHEAAAALPRARPPEPSDAGGPSASGANKRPRPAPNAAAAPRFAERDMFMSSSASSVHSRAPERAPRPKSAADDEPELDMKAFSRKVEQLGASQLRGMAKKDLSSKIAAKDQEVRMRMQLGLRAQKAPKMPYKRLLAVRKKQRSQDDTAADLAKQAGMTARRKPNASKQAAQAGRGGSGGRGGFGGAPSLGRSLVGGVLHVSNSDIKRTRFAAKAAGSASAGGGRGRGQGGKGKRGGGGGGGGKGRGRGGKGRGGR